MADATCPPRAPGPPATACCDRGLMLFTHVFAVFTVGVVAALLVPETSSDPTADRARYLLWAALACAVIMPGAFLARRLSPAVLGYWRWSSTCAFAAFVMHLGWLCAAGTCRWTRWALAAWWLLDLAAMWTSAGGACSNAGRLLRTALVAVVAAGFVRAAWRDGAVLPLALAGALLIATIVGLCWRWQAGNRSMGACA